MIPFPGDVEYINDALKEVGDQYKIPPEFMPGIAQVRECDPFRRVASLASNCADNSPEHTEQAVDYIKRHIIALEVALRAAEMILKGLTDALKDHKAKETTE